MIHMKYQVLFSLKKKQKNTKVLSAVVVTSFKGCDKNTTFRDVRDSSFGWEKIILSAD